MLLGMNDFTIAFVIEIILLQTCPSSRKCARPPSRTRTNTVQLPLHTLSRTRIRSLTHTTALTLKPATCSGVSCNFEGEIYGPNSWCFISSLTQTIAIKGQQTGRGQRRGRRSTSIWSTNSPPSAACFHVTCAGGGGAGAEPAAAGISTPRDVPTVTVTVMRQQDTTETGIDVQCLPGRVQHAHRFTGRYGATTTDSTRVREYHRITTLTYCQ
jgi:hypothetical protein